MFCFKISFRHAVEKGVADKDAENSEDADDKPKLERTKIKRPTVKQKFTGHRNAR